MARAAVPFHIACSPGLAANAVPDALTHSLEAQGVADFAGGAGVQRSLVTDTSAAFTSPMIIANTPSAVDAGVVARGAFAAWPLPAALTHTCTLGAAATIIAEEAGGTWALQDIVLAERPIEALRQVLGVALALPTQALTPA